jgi:ABC-2 type transport system permease protein
MLSGFLFPFRGMPLWAQIIGDAVPATYFIRIARGILLKGNDLAEIWPNLWPLLVFMLVITVIAMKRYRRTLD